MTTLNEALHNVWETDWKYRRSGDCLHSQAVKAINSILAFYAKGSNPLVGDITQGRLQVVTSQWYDEGLSPATITKRLNCLSKLGVNVTGCKPPKAKVLQWWLNPEAETKLLRHLRSAEGFTAYEARLMILYVGWATRTGLRVEETLALQWRHVYQKGGRWFVTVPGTKTSTSQATLPLSEQAGGVLNAMDQSFNYPGIRVPHEHVFLSQSGAPIGYDYLERLWGICRKVLGVEDVSTATLKALRRTAARHLHIECGMPLDMVREYLRHENIETTQGYLRLTGGYAAKDMEKFL